MQARCVACGMHLIGWIQAEWERSRKELDKARHDVERLRRALDRSDVEKRDQQHKATAVTQALQVEKKRKEKEKKRKEKKRKDYAFRRQYNEKPSIILGCPPCRYHPA